MSNRMDNRTFRARWLMARNAVLGSVRFQQLAARLPVFRMIARRKAAAQFDLVAGFVYSQILAAFVETRLLDFLHSGFRSTAEVAGHTGLTDEAAERLLRAAESLKLAESLPEGQWTLGEAGASLWPNKGAIAMIRHHRLLYQDLSDPVRLLAENRANQTALSGYWTYASHADGAGDTAGYSALMAATQPMLFEQILPNYPLRRHRRMLDIGGGSGAFAAAVKSATPQLDVAIFDLPDVINEARARLGNESPIALHAGSFKDDPLPGGYDLITLIRIAHDHDDEVVIALLAKIHAALPQNGKLLLAEPMAQSSGAERMGNAYFGLYLWAMGSGRPRSVEDYTQMLRNAGFSSVRRVKTALPLVTSAIVASR